MITPLRRWARPVTAAALVVCVATAARAIPPVPVPPENPITEPKRVLGKILFWDEQLSSDNTVACATCHQFNHGGGDNRRARNAGADNLFNTPDDVFSSPGVVRQDAGGAYKRDTIYAFQQQVTKRSAPSPILAAFANDTFWDGRARSTFTDPQTGQVAIVSGGGLESQAVGPPVSDAEMAHEAQNWDLIASKLAGAHPLALATALPADVVSALSGEPSYPELFRRAFGDTAITARRIAFAIATYERTLTADQTPFDRFRAGDNTAMTPGQQAGFQTFQAARCIVCHAIQNGNLLSDQSFRVIGLRPPTEDNGRQAVTGNINDRGRFKVPGLRNVGLKNSFMHNGEFTNLTDVVRFYARAPGSPPQFQDNIDPVMAQVRFPPQQETPLVDFLTNALTDPRVAGGQFPFDRAALYADRVNQHPAVLTGGNAGAGGVVPQVIANTPPYVGNDDFKIGLFNALAGAAARLVVSDSAPVGGRVSPDMTVGVYTVGSDGSATAFWPVPKSAALAGRTVYAQWLVTDASAAGGVAASSIARITFFCPRTGCETSCIADTDDGSGHGWPDGGVTIDDLLYYLSIFSNGAAAADLDNGTGTGTPDGGVTVDDLLYFLGRFSAGC